MVIQMSCIWEMAKNMEKAPSFMRVLFREPLGTRTPDNLIKSRGIAHSAGAVQFTDGAFRASYILRS